MKTKSANKKSSVKKTSVKSAPGKLSSKMRAAAAENHVLDPKHFAAAAGLRYVHDHRPGITREGKHPNFVFRDPHGKKVTDAATLQRIRSLVIPPAWTSVWICPATDGHIQATGIDARKRKQYRYHPLWRQTRDETKFHRMIAFGKALPKVRRATRRHLKLKGLPREKVLAALVQLLEKTLIRIGNEEYAKSNNSFGLTTIRNTHVKVQGKHVHFEFRGKSGVDHDIDLDDPVLAKVIDTCQHLPGQELFEYINHEGKGVDITSADVNHYLKEITGEEFSAKDFRTWNGTVLAAKALQEISYFDNNSQAKKNVLRAVEAVAKRLGNTRSVCRKCYIHPAVIDAYMDGSLIKTLQERAREEMEDIKHLHPEEAAVLAFLQERLRRDSRR